MGRSAVRRRLVLRPELRKHAESDGLFLEFGSEEHLTFEEPPGVDELPERIRAKLGDRTIPQPFVAEVPDVQLVGPDAMPVFEDGGVVFENLLGSVTRAVVSHVKTLAAGTAPIYRDARQAEDCSLAVSLVGPWDHEYHHWLSDYLTRLRGLEHYVEQTGDRPTVIVPADASDWMLAFLEHAGVDPDDCLEWTGGRLDVDRLVIPSLPRETELTFPGEQYEGYVFSPDAYRFLSRRISPSCDGSPEEIECSERVYISREDAPVRRVVNEQELLSALEPEGFRSYTLTDYSVADQVSLFSQAEEVIGPMGAGLTNIAFADNARVVTLFGDDQNACYYTQSQGLGHPFAYVVGEPAAGDMRVDAADVLKARAALEA